MKKSVSFTRLFYNQLRNRQFRQGKFSTSEHIMIPSSWIRATNTLVILSGMFFIHLAHATHPLLDENSRTYQVHHWQNEFQFNYFKTTANYSSEGGVYSDLPSGAEQQLSQINFGTRFTHPSLWAFYAQSQWAQAESKYANKSYENNSLTYFLLGADKALSESKALTIITDGSLLFPLKRYDLDNSQTYNQEGAAELTGRIILRTKIESLYPFAFLGLTYRDEGRSSLIPWGVGGELALGSFRLGGELRGYQTALRETRSKSIEKSTKALAANGLSLQFNSSNPNLLESNFWAQEKLSAQWAVKAGFQWTMTGTSVGAGWGAFAQLQFDFDEKKLPRKTTPQIEESPFKENTNDGVDQKLFKPEKPISDSDEELAPVPNSEYRKKKQKAPAKNGYKIQLKKKRR